MEYSFNMLDEKSRENLAYAQSYDVNASYKDLGAVCDAIRYMKAQSAVELIGRIIKMESPIIYRKHNKHMGARHELGGRKGAYPVKAAREVRLTLLNAIANAKNKGIGGEEETYIIHASANKTHIERRQPSKGSIAWGRGMYGRSAINHSDIEYAKIEIILASGEEMEKSKNAKYFMNKKLEHEKRSMKQQKEAKKEVKKKEKKPAQAADAKAKV